MSEFFYIGNDRNIAGQPKCLIFRHNREVMQTIFFDFANTRHVIVGKFSAKPHGTYRCHIWTQYGPYIAILAFLMYVHTCFIYDCTAIIETVIEKTSERRGGFGVS